MKEINFNSKLPHVGTTIFTLITSEAQKHNAINLAQGFPGFDCDDVLKTYVAEAMNEGKNQYAPMAGVIELRNVIADKMHKSQGIDVNSNDEITITAGATQGIFTTVASFIGHGDEVIVIEPAYDSYAPSILSVGGIPRFVSTYPPDFKIDWDELTHMINDKTKMIIINTPGNPSTKLWTKEDYTHLSQLVEGKDILILSDEVYEHLIFDGHQHISPLMIEPLRHKTIAIYSFGKTLHNTGWKIGYVVAAPYLMTEFRKVHQYNVFSVSSFAQYGIAKYLSDKPSAWESLPDFYQSKRRLLASQLSNSNLKPITSEGSFFLLYDYSNISDIDDLTFVYDLIKNHGIATIPLSSFYNDKVQNYKCIRLCFAKQDHVLMEGANRILSYTDFR
jgi:methionine transaminase